MSSCNSDLCQSALLYSPASDIDELVAAYDKTLQSLLDAHALYRIIRRSKRPSQHWYDAECHNVRRRTRALERSYRRNGSADTFTSPEPPSHRPLLGFLIANMTCRSISRARSARYAQAPRLPDRRPSPFASPQPSHRLLQ